MRKFHSDEIQSSKQGYKLCLGELSFVEEEAFDLGFEEWLRVHHLKETREAL